MRDLSRKMINACMIGDLKSVKELLKNGADIHFDDDDALKVSVEKKQYEIVEYLLNNGANIHADKNYAIAISVENGDIQMIISLIEKGADIYADNNFPLRHCVVYEKFEILNFLYDVYKKEVSEKVVKEYGSDIVNNWLKNKKLNDKLKIILTSTHNNIKIKKTKI